MARAARVAGIGPAVITVLLLVSFAFYSPLSFHRPLTHAECEWRNAVQHIVDCR